MLHQQFPLEIKSIGPDDGTFTGYGSVFGIVDDGRDIVQKGAFTDTLAQWRAKGKWPKLLWQHDTRQPIGVWTNMMEDNYGLRVEGRFTKGVQAAEEAYALVKDGAIDGLSIGYQSVDDEYDSDLNVRKLIKLNLLECSIVSIAMNDAAGVTSIKSLTEFNPRIAEKDLREAGFSSGDAVTAISVMKKHLQREAEVSASAAARDESGAMTGLLNAIKDVRAGLSS